MSRVVSVQTNFTGGEIDPKIRARIDLQQYYNSLEKAQNVIIQPQGGLIRRDGSRYITELTAAAGDAVRCVPFEFSVDDSYMLIFTDERMYVFKDRQLITNINASGEDYLTVTNITDTVIPTMCWAQSADTLIIVQQSMTPQKIVRGATDADWTITDLSFDFIPKFAFTLTTAAGSTFVTHEYLSLDATDGQITVTAKDSGDADEPIFTASAATYENQFINISPQGRLRVVKKVSDSQLKCYAEIPVFESDVTAAETRIPVADWEFESGYEDTWSANRGWPRAATFYESRLYLGGSTSRPSTLWGSRVGQFFNFDPGESFDDAAIEGTLDTGRFNAIVDLYAGRNLQIFSTGGEFYVPQTLGDPITPSTFGIQEQTSNGSKPGVRVVNVDGATVFLQRQGKALAEFIFSDTVNGYVSTKISLLSSHLLKNPIDMSVRKATSTDEGDRLLLVNSDDGSIACYTLLRSQQIIAPSEWVTDGEYIAIGVDIEDIYTVV
ncbi:MAG TPA: hypothetical protein VIC30_12340, partial [Orrella sp.]